MVIHIKKLNVKSLGELDGAVTKALLELKILPVSVVSNKPARLVALRIKEQYITSKSGYIIDQQKKGGDKEEKTVDISLTHYHFVL